MTAFIYYIFLYFFNLLFCFSFNHFLILIIYSDNVFFHITIPMIFVICNTVRWPIMFAVAVSVWAILDLISVLWMKKKDTQI